MGHIYNLIERATDTNLNLENNQIGKYRITPQHGNVAVYHIYKNDATYLPANRKYIGREQHVSTITISFNRVDCEVNSNYLKPFEIHQVQDVLNNLYDGFDINLKNM